MALIRRTRSSGRRAVAGKLDEVRKRRGADNPGAWSMFIQALHTLYFGAEADLLEVRRGMDLDPERLVAAAMERLRLAEDRLRAQPPSALDGLIPWVWHEGHQGWIQNSSPDGQARRTVIRERLPLIRDWWLGKEAPVDIMRLNLGEAYEAAVYWHRLEEEAVARGEVRLTRQQRRALQEAQKHFTKVMVWPTGINSWEDGSWLGVFTGDLVALRAVGQVLAHCYRKQDLAMWYSREYTMLVLFSAKNAPLVAFAALDWGTGADWTAMEIRGVGNVFPDRQFWPHVARILDIDNIRAFTRCPDDCYIEDRRGIDQEGEPFSTEDDPDFVVVCLGEIVDLDVDDYESMTDVIHEIWAGCAQSIFGREVQAILPKFRT